MNGRPCVSADCHNEAHPEDRHGMCLDCNPSGDSMVMNNDPEYRVWLFSGFDR